MTKYSAQEFPVTLVATVPCKSLRHKSNIFHVILVLCTCLFTETSMDKTNKTPRNSYVQNLCWKCSPFPRTRVLKRSTAPLRSTQSLPRWRTGPAASTPSADVLSTPSHHGSTNGRPSLEGYRRRCSLLDLNPANWVATSLGDKL